MNKPLKVPEHVLSEQYASSDPALSAWVSANAGSGKTHVLTQRVIRLMLAGNAPDRILCLMFTKAAAANMKARVFDTLAGWTMMEDAELDSAIRVVSGGHVSSVSRSRARRLFTQALDTPGGLKIQTIHAFCEALLHQFPLEANVPGHFETVQELGQVRLLEEAKAYVLAGKSRFGDVSKHLRDLYDAASQDAIERGIQSVISDRNAFMEWISGAESIKDVFGPLYDDLNIATSDTPLTIKADCLTSLPVSLDVVAHIAQIAGESGSSRDTRVHALLEQMLNSRDVATRFEALAEACLTSKGELRSGKSIVTKFVREREPDAPDALLKAGEAVLLAREKISALNLLHQSRSLFHIAEAVLERYTSLKRARGLIDFEDQVEKCALLLNRSEIRDWIRYRLDRGIDHVLVDEAQDTSPRQWEIINAITADFNSGESAAIRDRTVFVVGDEKQSIYSFQGAKPAEFASQRKQLEKSVRDAGKSFHPGRLALSFRSAGDVLHAVDRVFESEATRKGLTQSGEPPTHDAVRSDPGCVEVWPVFSRAKTHQTESWLDPVDHAGQLDPALQLAERICDEIAAHQGRPLPGSDEPLNYGDILVLVRKRDRFITALPEP